MAFWNKKNNPQPPPTDWMAYATQQLQAQLDTPSRLENGLIYLPELGMALQLSFETMEGSQGHYRSDLAVRAWHPDLPFTFYEMAACAGTSYEETIQRSLFSFLHASMDGWRKCLSGNYCDSFTNVVQGKERLYHVSTSEKVYLGIGPKAESEGQDCAHCLWHVLKQELPKYLGAPKLNWVKAYIGLVNGENISEVRVNDMRIEHLSKLLQQYAETLGVTSRLYSEKQMFFISQDDSTYVPYPYTKQEIQAKTLSALKLLAESGLQGDWDVYYSNLTQLCAGDDMLFTELDCFPREMAALYLYRDQVTCDYELFMFRNGARQETFYIPQMSAYCWIQETMLDALSKKKLPSDLFALLLSNSAIYQLMEQAKQKNSSIAHISGFGVADEDHTFQIR